MKNRTRYIVKVNEYDLMMNIHENTRHGSCCPIKAVSGKYEYSRCVKYAYKCKDCVQKWLNEED